MVDFCACLRRCRSHRVERQVMIPSSAMCRLGTPTMPSIPPIDLLGARTTDTQTRASRFWTEPGLNPGPGQSIRTPTRAGSPLAERLSPARRPAVLSPASPLWARYSFVMAPPEPGADSLGSSPQHTVPSVTITSCPWAKLAKPMKPAT